MLIGYARLSRRGDPDSMSIENQRRVLAGAGVDADRIYEDVGVSGTVAPERRAGFGRMMEFLRDGDVLVLVRLDRLTRTTLDGLTMLAKMRDEGIGVRCLSPDIDLSDDSPAKRLWVGMQLLVAEYERGLVVERTMAGLKTAREAGRVGGRPRLPEAVVGAALEAVAGGESIRSAGRRFGVAPASIRRARDRNK